MQIYAGTSGYSFKEWKGTYYPPGLRQADWLSFYAQNLSAVEINSSFYRMPTAKTLETWAAQVPADFRFAIKASRRITHLARLREVEQSVEYLLETTSLLGARLGPLLFQLPPDLPADWNALAAVLAIMPRGVEVVLEPRHASWLEPRLVESLATVGGTVCVTDTRTWELSAMEGAPAWRYLRLPVTVDDGAQTLWIERLSALPLESAYVFFKHDDAGEMPRTAAAFAQRLSHKTQRV